MKDLLIREALESDIDRVMVIEKEGGGDWKREYFLNELRNPFSLFLCALAGEELAGFAVVWNAADELQLNNIAVGKNLRRYGIGRALLEFIKKYPYKEKPARIFLEVREKNAAAIAFYETMGFKAAGTRQNYYGDDNAVLMEKTLDEI
ncbi:MAG: ribosomal protein S18-alanine N-acetyltransferase [Leptospirales bacterium]|nr:ribosomal protein S18-alanine N-acetyltransferase [Leptospirales bacterium]